MENILVSGQRFIDGKGRHVILHGVNMIHKGEVRDGKLDYIPNWGEEDFKNLRNWGFNVIRLGLIWNAIEPSPGVYDEEYLDWAYKILDLCSKYQIYAYLDMHQDLYGVLFGNGAPEWATITDGEPHVKGLKWSDAYISSGAVKRAFDNFWDNTPIADGKGIQDYYIDMWSHVVEKFYRHPSVIGYDFLNEPHPGSMSDGIFEALIGEMANVMKDFGVNRSLEELSQILSREDEMMELLDILEDKSIYLKLTRAIEPLVERFDRGPLGQFYNRITQAIREIDSKKIVMRENSYFSNIGIQCRAEPIVLGEGRIDPSQAFAPHGYDFVVDTDATPYASNSRIDVIFDAHRRTQKDMDVPVMVGEWGAHYHHGEGLSHIEHLLSIFEKNLWSNTYWCYVDDFYSLPVLNILKRPYPQAVCGELLNYEYKGRENVFTMEWDEGDCHAPSTVYLPTEDFKVDLEGDFNVETLKDSCLIVIPSMGGRRRICISW